MDVGMQTGRGITDGFIFGILKFSMLLWWVIFH